MVMVNVKLLQEAEMDVLVYGILVKKRVFFLYNRQMRSNQIVGRQVLEMHIILNKELLLQAMIMEMLNFLI